MDYHYLIVPVADSQWIEHGRLTSVGRSEFLSIFEFFMTNFMQ